MRADREKLDRDHPGKWLAVYHGKIAVGQNPQDCFEKLKSGKSKLRDFDAAAVKYRNPAGKWFITLPGIGIFVM
jgi:hypothetical protein